MIIVLFVFVLCVVPNVAYVSEFTIFTTVFFVFFFILLYNQCLTKYLLLKGSLESWKYGNWIYNYLCNQSLSQLKLWIQNPLNGEVYSMQHFVKEFGSDWRQVGGFLRVVLFPPPIKLTATI